ncbi:unnamed protein product [Vitrella brassicaformis CCMP3155]|uniref:Uncharacterized protein n=1 Tax=Vitrella brassicaformis (strain CCMP3155) TaxID=1169540 RepID=A0A0G4EZW4_VITBC|nr:unnamed protein product [Vitrella brassicaformis CCMP3155]|eukprot:CEM04374.1 unnamed protein product [Vitrella brassicaformis CCMP3155]
MSAADGAGGSANEPSSSAASAAGNGAGNAPSAHQQQQHDRPISASDVPQDLAPTVAEYVRSYAQLEALIAAHPTQFTAAVLLPILTRLLPVVVEAMFGVLVEVPIPQLALEVAALVPSPHRSALPLLAMRLLGVLLPIVGLGSFLVWIIPRLPLPQSLSHGCRMAYLIEQLTRRLKRLERLERGRDWGRWPPHLEMLYLLRGKRPLVLSGDNFGVFGSRAAFVSETEAVRQWKILSRGVTVSFGGQQIRLMDGDSIFHPPNDPSAPTLLTSASARFRFPDPFDRANPPTQLPLWTYRSYTSMVAFVLFDLLYDGGRVRWIKFWTSCHPASAASQRVCELLTASASDAAQWGPGVAVFDKKWSDGAAVRRHRLVVVGSEVMGEGHMAAINWLMDGEGHQRLVVFGSKAMGDGHMAIIQLADWGDCSRSVTIRTTESAPHDKTRTAVMRMLGDHLGGKVWRGEWER